jgi:SAM-dependent methyltransferase
MFDYEEVADRFWNQPQKGDEEAEREQHFMDDIIQKAHIERAILDELEDVETVFDGGAGSGRFSVMLAKLGKRVTHFDISAAMIRTAQAYAEREGVLTDMQFVQGRLGDLSRYGDNAFDMVVSFDAPVSYTWPGHESVLAGLARITGKTMMVSVSSRLGSLPYLLNPIQKSQYILDPTSEDSLVRWYAANEESALEQFRVDMPSVWRAWESGLFEEGGLVRERFEQGGTPWPVTYLFMPEELQDILTRCGLSDIRLSGPGAFSRSIPQGILRRIMGDQEAKAEFLRFCYSYDSHPAVAGMGKDNLLAIGRKQKR